MSETSNDIDFLSLSREVRAVALVGRYLQAFAFMENEVDNTVAKLLKLENMQQYVLSPNIPFINKLHILRTLVNLSILPPTRKKRYLRTLNDVMGQSAPRNVIAHNPFAESNKSDGVMFLVTRSQGDVQFIEWDWSVERFNSEFQILYRFEETIKEMGNIITQINLRYAALAAALTTPPPPTPGFSELNLLGLVLPLAGADHTQETNAANSETTPQTDPSPRE